MTETKQKGYGPATVILPRGTAIKIKSAIFAPSATRNLISFQDIRANNLHIHTSLSNKREVLQILEQTPEGMKIREVLPTYPPGLYVTQIHMHTIVKPIQTTLQ